MGILRLSARSQNFQPSPTFIPMPQLPRSIFAVTALVTLGIAPAVQAGPAVPRVQSDTAVPITRISFNSAAGDFTHRTAIFTVPDRDTTVSAYGGKLRRYDVHIAKMIEITHTQWCSDRPKFEGVYWNYRADDGNIEMGKFYVTCKLAKQMVSAYGLGRSERTVMYFNPGDVKDTADIPVLNLNGDKIPKFIQWVKNFKPQSS
ncbi:hypothetical protein [Alkalinema sp. FACHB-956]|uniref:hypothetical protein n=1 Tax=Alkalinema sp. FACHB-956 TaxID=2692768 RepID=UPI0016848ECE|nr:hypothetical protein [Alkalinema sp. FACHB-956]MBD2326151.1 hypothetical protein [Alkalinema sp. FACHB-956]